MMELLERDQILETLHGLLRQAGEGHGRMVMLGGEAGVGKTALLRHFSDEARAAARVQKGNCDPLSTPRVLGPLFDLDIPSLNRLLVEDAPRDQIFRTVLASFTSANRPTLLIIEDIHWADEATLDLLRFLARRLESTRTLTIVTYRDDEVGPRHRLRRLLGDLANASAVQRLALPPLTIQAVSILAAGSGLDVATLHERTRGNPFFVTEVLAAGGEIPPNVRDAVLARASRLASGAWTLLEAAAVLGSPIATSVLDGVVPRAPGDLEDCLDSGMLSADGASLAFRHELAREAILAAISPPRRTALHREILRLLEGDSAHRHDFARLAHHAEGAGDAAAVLRHAPEAARRAAMMRAHREEAGQYDRALRFSDALPPETRAQLLEARSFACYLTAQIDQAIDARQAALAIWIGLGGKRQEGENRCYLALLYWARAHTDEAEKEARAAVHLLETLPPGRELAMAYGTLARLRGTTLNDSEAISWGDRAIALADRFAAPETLADALITVGVARLARGDFALGHRQLERGIEISAAEGLDDLTARAYANLGFGYDEHYLFAYAAEHFARGVDFCTERDLDNSRLHMTAWFARCQLFLGHWDNARELVESVLRAPNLAPVTRFVALLVEAMIRTRQGDANEKPMLDEALELAIESESLYRLGPIRAARAEAAFLAGSVPAASAEAEAAYGLALEHGQQWYAGELAYWLWKGGALVATPAGIAEPFALQIAGNWASAAAAWDALGCPYEAARARAEGSDESALLLALASFDSLGARPAAALVRSRLRKLGARNVPRGPRPSTRAHPAGLTAREVDVVTLLAEGHGNQVIAERLFLSSRTIENHVAAILIKLGAPSRSEAASAARRLGILPQSE